ARRPLHRCCKKRAAFPSFSRTLPIRLAAASSRAFRGRAATSPDSSCSSRRWRASGWSCSRRLRRASTGSPSCSTRQRRHILNITGTRSKPPLHRSAWRRSAHKHQSVPTRHFGSGRAPAVHGNGENVDAGGLVSYGPNFPALFRRGAFGQPRPIADIARAQTYPTRPVHLIVPFGPAGATDITARLIGQWVSERLGQPFVIGNRPGAGSNVGTEAVVRAAPDGYTLGLFGAPSAINATLYDKLNFNFVRDIAPVAPIVRFPNIMVANPSIPSKTLPDFIAYAKANPGKINMASPGIGSAPHVASELFKVMTGTNLVHVPYRSAAAVITDLLSGQVQLYFGTTASLLE